MNRTDLENRLKQRYPTSLYVSVLLSETEEFFGLLADLSGTGFKLTTGTEITAHQEYQLAIRSPFSGRNEELNHFVAKSIWCNTNEEGLYEIGFQFVSFDLESQKLFNRLITDFESTARSMNKL